MSGDAGTGHPGEGAPALVAVVLAALLVPQQPEVVRVGRVDAVYWGADAAMATALAEYADQAGPWPGLPASESFPIRLIVTRSAARYDSLTAGRLPDWSAGAAFPASSTIVLRVNGNPFPTLAHELAHLALHRVAPRTPLWFAEGYAARAAGEWNRLDALELNWALMAGGAPTFIRLNQELRSGRANARAAYAMATAAVLFLERLGGTRGLEPLITNLAETGRLDMAVRRTHLVTIDQLEQLWRRDLRSRYGWVRIFTSFALFWGLTAVLVGVVWLRRRRRDRERKARLDEGWIVPVEDAGESA